MITLHHLNNSRSQRILWLLEELGVPYEVKRYQRDATTRLAPPELKAVHPLGKSPVVTDGANVVAESGAIVEYLIDTYGNGRLRPAEGTPAMVPYRHWLHFAEGSAMLPLMLALYTSRLGEAAAPLAPRRPDRRGHPNPLRDRSRGRQPVAGGIPHSGTIRRADTGAPGLSARAGGWRTLPARSLIV